MGRRIATAATLVAAGNVLSRLLGFIREPIVAALLGAGGQADAFEVASRIPTMVFDVVIGGAISAVLIPVFGGLSSDRRASSELFYTLLLAVGMVLGLAVALVAALADPLIGVVAAGFDIQTQHLAANMLRLTIPGVLFLGLSAIASGWLYAEGRFVLPAFSVSALNGAFIAAALAFTPLVGAPGVALGYLAGSAAHLAIQIPGLALAKIGTARPRPLANQEFRRVMVLYAPVLAGLIFAQFITLVDTRLAAASGEGSLAMMRFATRLQQFPLGIVVAAVSLATLPALSRAAPVKFAGLPDATQFRQVLSASIRHMALLVIPATALMIGLAEPIIRFVYVRGEFQAAATGPTATALLIYSLQVPLVALDQLFIFAYYSARNTLTPVLVGAGGGIVYLLVAFPLVGPLGFHGLVWANTIQNSLHGLAMGALLWRALRAAPNVEAATFGAKLIPATAALIAGLIAGKWVASAIEPPAGAGIATIAIASLFALVAYAIGLWAFRLVDVRAIGSLALARLRGEGQADPAGNVGRP